MQWPSDELGSRPAIHDAVSRGDIEEAANILKQPRSKSSINALENATEIMSDLSHSDSEKPKRDPPSTDTGFIPASGLLSSESIEKYVLPHSLYDSQSFTPLHVAASLDVAVVGPGVPADITRMLLSAGGDVRCTDKNGNTALHWAARSGNGDVAHLLTLKNCSLGIYGPKSVGSLFRKLLPVTCLTLLS